ncbi:unnamed protein product [Amoebophrya sp. A120]|nr:unnamed protein product [Amoebophrya sp. A120]|eukprot:GSA120T00013502001.1
MQDPSARPSVWSVSTCLLSLGSSTNCYRSIFKLTSQKK